MKGCCTRPSPQWLDCGGLAFWRKRLEGGGDPSVSSVNKLWVLLLTTVLELCWSEWWSVCWPGHPSSGWRCFPLCGPLLKPLCELWWWDLGKGLLVKEPLYALVRQEGEGRNLKLGYTLTTFGGWAGTRQCLFNWQLWGYKYRWVI